MVRYLILILIWVPVTSPVFSQLPDDFPSIGKNDLPGLKITSTRIFIGKSLFGYIDGGAELYLEYGFSYMSVVEADFMDGRFKTEIYEMTGPEEAFGIFSVSRFHCNAMPYTTEVSCQTKYQLQFCKGSYYVSIINKTGSENDSVASITIGKLIIDKISEKNPDFNSYIPAVTPLILSTNCIFVKGKLGIINGVPALEDFFGGLRDFTALILKESEKYIISVKFMNKEAYNGFLQLHRSDESRISSEFSEFENGRVRKKEETHLLIELPVQQ